MKFSSKIEKCVESPIRKFQPFAVKAEKNGKKIYHLNIGQPDVETPKPFFDALKGFNEKVVAYAPSNGISSLIDSIINYYDKLGMHFDSSNILITSGGSEALFIIFNCILDNCDELLVPEPFYPNYATMANLAGAKIHPISTTPEENYFYADRNRIEREINEHTRAILVTNPGNPTGTVLTHEEMKVIVDIALKYNLFIIGDEAYREFIYEQESTLSSFAEFENAKENVIVVDTISKRFSACGARIGCIVSRNKQLMAHALKQCQARLSVATIEQLAAQKLYETNSDYFSSIRDEYRNRRDTIIECLNKIPGVRCQIPKGAFYVMPTLPVDDTDKFQEWLLTKFDDNGDTVMFAPGEPFFATKGLGKNTIRIAYVNNCEYLKRAIEILGKGINEYNQQYSR